MIDLASLENACMPWADTAVSAKKGRSKYQRKFINGIPVSCQKIKRLLLFKHSEGLTDIEIMWKLKITKPNLETALKDLSSAGFQVNRKYGIITII